MTCIVAIETKDNNAVIAGDFCGSNGFTRGNVTQPKVFKHSGMMFGYTSTFRFGQIIEHILDDNTLYPPNDHNKTYEWLVRNFIPKLMQVLKAEEYGGGGDAICVINSQVWQIQSDFSVLRPDTGVCAIGSGEYHALSSILTTMLVSNNGDLPKDINQAWEWLETAYKVTSACIPSVSGKFSMLEFK
jgi:ATP-dependent protease HslVU (ClpYQ) peptidase subunit